MIGPLFRKLYLYAVVSVFASIVLTIFGMNLFFSRNQEDMRSKFLQDQASFINYVLQNTAAEDPDNPRRLDHQIEQIGTYVNWDISYWKNRQQIYANTGKHKALSPEQEQLLLENQEPVVLSLDTQPLIAAYLNPEKPELGYFEYTPRFSPHGPDKEGRPPRFLEPIKRPPPPKGAIMRPPPGPDSAQVRPDRHRPPPPHGLLGHWGPPLLFGLLILLSLAVLLIPYALYIIKPFKELSTSMEKVASGDFSHPIDVSKKSEFQGIANAFNHMTERIREMIEEKQRLIADVSHELRSPLARMRVSMELLDKEGKGKKKYIERSILELEELDLLINDILDVSALELNADNYPLEKIELAQLVENNLEIHSLIFAEHQVQVMARYPNEKVFINGRKDLLERALNNLLSNVLKYAPNSAQLDIIVFIHKDKAGIRIRDRGPGIPAEELDQILKPFYRPDVSRTRKTGGTGLGLAIVQKIMQVHKGQIRFELPEDLDGGLVAVLEWPIRRRGKTENLSTEIS